MCQSYYRHVMSHKPPLLLGDMSVVWDLNHNLLAGCNPICGQAPNIPLTFHEIPILDSQINEIPPFKSLFNVLLFFVSFWKLIPKKSTKKSRLCWRISSLNSSKRSWNCSAVKGKRSSTSAPPKVPGCKGCHKLVGHSWLGGCKRVPPWLDGNLHLGIIWEVWLCWTTMINDMYNG